MKKLTKAIDINAPKEKVWKVLLEDETYRKWTSVFMEGSHAETDWQEGSKVYFKGPDGDGMVSRIKIHKPNDIISIEHLGILKDGKEEYEHEDVKDWQGTTETYKVTGDNSQTHLVIEQDLSEQHIDWFNSTWEKALQKVKELAE